VHASIASPPVRPSPYRWRVGIRIFTFEACSGFTLVTARRIARPPKATFVTRLQCGQLPSYPARQLPDLSTTIWVDSSSTGDTRPFGAHSDMRDGHQPTPRMSLRSSGLRLLADKGRDADERVSNGVKHASNRAQALGGLITLRYLTKAELALMRQ
jgi:hypothetical protein